MDQHQKLRLKVSTNTGLNIFCTVSKQWTVNQLYPHITRLYKEVTEDQSGDEIYVHITTLKKNSYYIPKSQVVGELFVDGDQITCNVQSRIVRKRNGKSTTSKKDRIKDKKQSKNIKIQQSQNENSQNQNKQKQDNKKNENSGDKIRKQSKKANQQQKKGENKKKRARNSNKSPRNPKKPLGEGEVQKQKVDIQKMVNVLKLNKYNNELVPQAKQKQNKAEQHGHQEIEQRSQQ